MQKKSTSKSGKSKTKKNSKTDITYVTKQVDTSVALLASPEDALVLEALVYLLEYADINENNLIYILQHGLLQKLLNLLNRNDVRILRVTFKFLGALLSVEEVMQELTQKMYDERVLEISKVFMSHSDRYVKQCTVAILSKLTDSLRIVALIFNLKLFPPILDIIENTTDMDLLESTLELLLRLVAALAAVEDLPKEFDFNVAILMKCSNNQDKKIVNLSYEVIHKLTYYCLDDFQKKFRTIKLIEYMLEVLMNEKKQEYHNIALDIIFNSMKSNETSDYFIETLEFLKFCQWVKTCDQSYHFPCILIIEQLTRIPSRKQILFDFSVEDSIISFLRSSDEKVINKTCEAISNMTTHMYCCEEMLKPALLKTLFQILSSRDHEETGNEMALKTILDFSRKNLNTLDIVHSIGAHKVLLGYFKKGIGYISEESFLAILELLHKMSICPQLQQDIATSSFFENLLELFRTAPADTVASVCEMMIHFINCPDFRRVFLLLEGPRYFMEKVFHPKDEKILKNVLLFVYSSLEHDNVVESFLQNNVAEALKELPAHLKEKMPIADKILRLIYKIRLPLKFFETNRLDITDKMQNTFYLINGYWHDSFPFLKDFEETPVSTAYVIYVVDYSFEVKLDEEVSTSSDSITPAKISSERTMSTLSRVSSSVSSYIRRGPFHINYGKLTSDPFLPTYLCHVSKYLAQVYTTEHKVRILAKYIDAMLCEPVQGYTKLEKIHHLKLHVEILKHKLGSNTIPVGFLRLGGMCERALLFKAMADKCCIPATLVRGTTTFYWNEVLLFDSQLNNETVKLYVVDLTNNIGNLLVVGSRTANQYCNIAASKG